MSEGFIDSNVILRNTISKLPGGTSGGYDAGHKFSDIVSGNQYLNEGPNRDEGTSIFGSPGVNRYELVENFRKTPLLNASIVPTNLDPTQAEIATILRANLDFELAGTNAADSGSVFADGGGIQLTTAASINDQMLIQPHQDANQSSWAATKWNTNDRIVFQANVKLTSVADVILWAGFKLTNTSVIATDNDQAYFRFESGVNSGKFQTITSNAGTDTTFNTDVTVAADTNYDLKVLVDANRRTFFYVNGVQVARSAALLASNVDLIPYIGVQTKTTAAKVIRIRNLRCSKDLND